MWLSRRGTLLCVACVAFCMGWTIALGTLGAP